MDRTYQHANANTPNPYSASAAYDDPALCIPSIYCGSEYHISTCTMTIFESQGNPVPYPPPENKTLPQFVLDGERPKPADKPDIPEYPCLIEEATGKKVYIDELRSRTDSLARAFSHNWRLGATDVVSLCSYNHIDYAVCLWAGHRLGCIVAPMSPSLTVDEMVHQLRIAKPSLLIVHFDSLPVALSAILAIGLPHSRIVVVDPPETETNFTSLTKLITSGKSLPPFKEFQLEEGEGKTKVAVLIFSSGTTGVPKAVSISHHNLVSFLVQVTAYFRVHEPYTSQDEQRFRAGDLVSGVLPLYHIYGLASSLNFTIYSRMTLVVSPKFNFEAFLASISRYRITHLMLVPPQAVLLCKHPAAKKADLSTIRCCMLAGAPVTAELTQQLLDLMPQIHLGQGYGLTETCAAITLFPITQKVGTLGSGGRLISGTVGKVVKHDGTLAGPGEPGELWLKGGQIAIGYYGNEQATREAFQDGWLRTGDQVVIEDNGDLFVLDRLKEIIKVKGNQVAPAELEGHLLDHPDVADAGVVGIPDDYAGELPLAFIALHPELSVAVRANPQTEARVRKSIFKHVADSKSRYKWLTGGIEFIDAIPKNASGKILRRVLREKAKSIPRRESGEPRARL